LGEKWSMIELIFSSPNDNIYVIIIAYSLFLLLSKLLKELPKIFFQFEGFWVLNNKTQSECRCFVLKFFMGTFACMHKLLQQMRVKEKVRQNLSLYIIPICQRYSYGKSNVNYHTEADHYCEITNYARIKEFIIYQSCCLRGCCLRRYNKMRKLGWLAHQAYVTCTFIFLLDIFRLMLFISSLIINWCQVTFSVD